MELKDGERIIVEQRSATFRGETFTYMHTCIEDETGRRWTTTELDAENSERVWSQYRERHGIPSPREIISLRMEYCLTCDEMAHSLGWDSETWARYEEGEVPSVHHAYVIGYLLKKKGRV